MKATVLDLRRNTGKILDAIERNETIILTKRGKEIASIVPSQGVKEKPSLKDSPFFGMWADREEMADPAAYLRGLREPPTPSRGGWFP